MTTTQEAPTGEGCADDVGVVLEVGPQPSGVEPVVTLDLGGDKTADVDASLVPLVLALNHAGIRTVASCSGHTHRPGNIALADGRELIVCPDFDTARKVDAAFPDIHGRKRWNARATPISEPAQGGALEAFERIAKDGLNKGAVARLRDAEIVRAALTRSTEKIPADMGEVPR